MSFTAQQGHIRFRYMCMESFALIKNKHTATLCVVQRFLNETPLTDDALRVTERRDFFLSSALPE